MTTDTAAAPRQRRGRRTAVDIAIAVALGAISIAAIAVLEPLFAGGVLLTASALFLARRLVFTWTSMLFLLGAIVMFIPIRRYALPIEVGFALEPFRVIIVGLLVALAVASVTTRSFQWKPVLWGWPVAIFFWTLLASLMFNAVPLVSTGLIVAGLSNITQMALLISVMFITRQLLSDETVVKAFLTFLVFAGAIVGLLALYERVSRTNIFLLLGNVLPLTILRDDAETLRAGGARAYASAQHPIALSVLFCMLIPIAIYLMKFGVWPRYAASRRIVFTIVCGAMLVGMLAAVSRTGVVTLGVMFLLTLLLRPRLALMLAAIGAPIAAVAGLVLPQMFEAMVLSLLNVDEVVASQFAAVGLPGQGRLADLPGAFESLSQNPWAGTGLGSRIVVGDYKNADILDNQVLGSVLETGLLGAVGLIALLIWPPLRMLHFSFRSGAPESRVFLTFAIAVSTVGYVTAMFFHDSFAFMQTLLVLSMLYAVAAWAMTHGAETWRARTTSGTEVSADA